MAEHEPTGGATPPIALAIGQVVEAIARTGDTGALDEAMSAVFAIYTRIRRSAPSTDAHTSFPTGDQPQTADTHKP